MIKDSWFVNGYDSPDVDFDDFIDSRLKVVIGDEND